MGEVNIGNSCRGDISGILCSFGGAVLLGSNNLSMIRAAGGYGIPFHM